MNSGKHNKHQHKVRHSNRGRLYSIYIYISPSCVLVVIIKATQQKNSIAFCTMCMFSRSPNSPSHCGGGIGLKGLLFCQYIFICIQPANDGDSAEFCGVCGGGIAGSRCVVQVDEDATAHKRHRHCRISRLPGRMRSTRAEQYICIPNWLCGHFILAVQ